LTREHSLGRELATGRKIAIKKIKVGQFKDGLDMSAVREVKYLRELHHPNIIEVHAFLHECAPPSFTLTHSRLSLSFRSASCFVCLHSKLLDVFSSKTNLNLVLEFLDTDLEMIIKDRTLVFLPADIKSWMAMTFRGLEFCHRNFILHRVRTVLSLHTSPSPRGDQSCFSAYRPTNHLYHPFHFTFLIFNSFFNFCFLFTYST
jgi:serine/threonine protein kinase